MRGIFVFCVILFLSHASYAQVDASEMQPMSFGEIIVSPSGDTIALQVNGAISSAQGSDLQGGHQVGVFRITAPPATSVSYSFSSGDTLTGGGESIGLENITGNLPILFTMPGGGAIDMSVGADLVVPSSLNGGSFSGSFTLTIDNP